MTKLGLINPRNVNLSVAQSYKLREAVRAIVFDGDKKIALLNVSRDNYFKLPGGGVDEGEDYESALRRECLEEIGCRIRDITPLGFTEEYWEEDLEKQISHCYVAKLDDAKGAASLTDSEQSRGFETLWVTFEEAIKMLSICTPTHWEGDYIPQRELIFLNSLRDNVSLLGCYT